MAGDLSQDGNGSTPDLIAALRRIQERADRGLRILADARDHKVQGVTGVQALRDVKLTADDVLRTMDEVEG